MSSSIRQLDRILRGETTALDNLRGNRLEIPVVGLTFLIVVLGMIYGACMGLFAILGEGSGKVIQIPASMLKVPALFLLTLLVTFPSLYVFNALVGSRLTFAAVLKLLIASLAVMLAVLASLGPIVAFFSISSTSYGFIKLLNVIVFALSGFLGLAFLLQTLHRISIADQIDYAARSTTPPPVEGQPESAPQSSPPAPVGALGALDRLEGHVLGSRVKFVFRIWVLVFGLVGAQMAWVLRPFIGAPGRDFEWLRERQGNFFESVWQMIVDMLRSGAA
jgi:hypothetical protein